MLSFIFFENYFVVFLLLILSIILKKYIVHNPKIQNTIGISILRICIYFMWFFILIVIFFLLKFIILSIYRDITIPKNFQNIFSYFKYFVYVYLGFILASYPAYKTINFIHKNVLFNSELLSFSQQLNLLEEYTKLYKFNQKNYIYYTVDNEFNNIIHLFNLGFLECPEENKSIEEYHHTNIPIKYTNKIETLKRRVKYDEQENNNLTIFNRILLNISAFKRMLFSKDYISAISIIIFWILILFSLIPIITTTYDNILSITTSLNFKIIISILVFVALGVIMITIGRRFSNYVLKSFDKMSNYK